MKIIYYDEPYLNQCAQLFLDHYNQEAFGCHFTLERSILYLQELIYQPRFVGFLLLDEDQLVGFAFCHLRTWSEKDEIVIDEMIIASHCQNQGRGTKLLAFIETYSISYGLAGITTQTNVWPLIQFYQKNDYFDHDITFLYKGIETSAS